MSYTSLLDLFRQWVDRRNIEPSRRRWSLYVRDDVLYDGGIPVGLPIEGSVPRSFWYLITHFSGRFELRSRLESYGCYPCLPHELLALLPYDAAQAAMPHASYSPDDAGALEAISTWLQIRQPFSLHWRSCLLTGEGKLDVGRIIRGQPVTVTVAWWADWNVSSPQNLRLLHQVRRNPPLLWVRDAVYTAFGRLLGSGVLPSDATVGLWDGRRTSPSLRIKPTPLWVCDALAHRTGREGG